MVRYALKFDHPIPLSVSNLRQISELTEIHHEALSSDKKDHEKPQPLLELIIKNCSHGKTYKLFRIKVVECIYS